MGGFASLKILLEIAQAVRRADFVEALVDFEPSKPVLEAEFMKQTCEIGGSGTIEQIAAQAGKAVIDKLHFGHGCFVVQDDAPRLVDHIAAIPAALIAKDGHQRRLVAGLKRPPNRPE